MLQINNVFISDNQTEIRINKDGIYFYNERYDTYKFPYIRYGLKFVEYNNKLKVNKIEDITLKNIIIPNSSFKQYNQNDKSPLLTCPVIAAELELNHNVEYIYVPDSIEELTLTSDEIHNIILSVPNKLFVMNLTNINITHLILREHKNNNFNLTLDSKIIDLTHNPIERLYGYKTLTSIEELDVVDYDKYKLISDIKLKDKDKTFYFKDIISCSNFTNSLIFSNIDLNLSIDNNKLIYNSSYVEVQSSIKEVQTYSHYALIYDNKWWKFDFYNNQLELLPIRTITIDDITIQPIIIEINNEIYYCFQYDDKIIMYDNLKEFPLLPDAKLIKFLRLQHTLVAFFFINHILYASYSDLSMNSFYLQLIDNTFDSDEFNSINYSDNTIKISYNYIDEQQVETKNIMFKAYSKQELLMKF